jgi:hypothetical protein
MASSLDEIDKILKSGPPLQARPKDPPVTAKSEPAPEAPATPDDNQDWAASRGLAKSVAGLGVGARNLLGMVPGLNDLARQYVPEGARSAYRQMREFSEEPSQSWLETAGGFVPYLFGGELGLGKIAAQQATKMLPTGAGFVKGLGVVRGATPTVTKIGVPAARIAGDVAGRATTGAVGGAAQNPDDPGTAALGGAVAGQVPAAAGAVMRSPVGRWAGGAALPALVAHHFGVPLGEAIAGGMGAHLMAQNIRWHHSPVGKRLFQAGRWIIDHTGRIIGEIPSQAAGAAAGQASTSPEVMQAGANQ